MEKVIMKTSYGDTGYCCMCELLPGWTASSGKDFKKFDAYVRESIVFYLDCAREDGDEYPSVFDGEYEIEYEFDIRALLNYYQHLLPFSGLQDITGINQKQLAHYAAGRQRPRPERVKYIETCIHNFADELKKVNVWV